MVVVVLEGKEVFVALVIALQGPVADGEEYHWKVRPNALDNPVAVKVKAVFGQPVGEVIEATFELGVLVQGGGGLHW